MPASFLVDVERRVIFLRLSGVVTEQELFATEHAVNGDSCVFDNLPDAMEFLGLDRDTPWPTGA